MILREENNNISIKLIDITSAIMRKINSDTIDKTYAMQRIEMVGMAILGNEYKRLYQQTYAKNNSIKGFIRPTPNSWLNLITNVKSTSVDKFGITPYNNDVLENLSKRVELELQTYKNKYAFMIQNYIKYVEDMIKTLKSDPILENLFMVQLIKEVDVASTLEEKGWLNKSLSTNTLVELPTNMSNSIYDIKNDLEIKILVEESFKALKGDTIETMNKVLSKTNPIDFNNAIKTLRVKDINALLGLLIIFKDKLMSTPKDSEEYSKLDAVVNTIIDSYRRIKNQYTTFLKNKVVITGVESKEDGYIIYAMEDNFNTYINEASGSLKTILGAVFSEINLFEQTTSFYKPLYIKNNDLIIDKAKFDSLRDSVQNAFILKNKNDTASSLRAYYMIAFDKITQTVTNPDRKNAESYINSLGIGDLYDTDNTCMEIVENYASEGTNFKLFSHAMQEAQEVLNTEDAKPLAGYATLKLILLYLIGQTEIV